MSGIVSSKGFSLQKSSDELISSIPLFCQPSSSTSAFKTATISSITIDDPELYMGDDCDASYEATLLNSGLLEWLSQDDTNIFHHPTTQKRLEMLLVHLTCIDSASDSNKE
ncbi:hypothetical protein BD408DRAFT_417337 [Parasitella parasitica]|nr:hypothetical protein BD408DRAFT_417337 [Parasitella parasitica]